MGSRMKNVVLFAPSSSQQQQRQQQEKKKVDYRLHTATTAAVAVDFIKVNSMSGSVFRLRLMVTALSDTRSLRCSTARLYKGLTSFGLVCLSVLFVFCISI